MSKEKISHDAIIIIDKKKKEVIIFILITLIVLTVLVTFPIRLMFLKIVQINNEIEGKRKIKEQLDTKITNFTQLDAEYQEIRDEILDMPLLYPNQGDYSLFVANLEEICKANNFRLRSVNVSRERFRDEENPFKKLGIWDTYINVFGQRSDLVYLLEDIESMPMFPTVRVATYQNELDDDAFLNFTVVIRMYGVDDSSIYLNI